MIHAQGMSQDFWKVSVFLRFPKVERHPKCMDHAILLGKPFGNCIYNGIGINLRYSVYIYEQCFSLSACGARQMTDIWCILISTSSFGLLMLLY